MARRAAQLSLMGSYLILAGILALVLWTAVISVPVIRQAEASMGHPLTCAEAYDYREINNYFFPNRAVQGTVLYVFSLFSFFFLLAFAALLAVITLYERLKRLRWPLVGAGLLLFAAVLVYMPVIRTVACATE